MEGWGGGYMAPDKIESAFSVTQRKKQILFFNQTLIY